ncbi:hypothetical protein Dsin_002727 [Dipteronia sinensis]|uniref:CCHC-type domain-containing protein n=1 Tax=Dipteronia sinensis TaxID=43782 RepID=A0AAE0B6A8_9ROSI|nr:hypothetical protein Dsin_002727 [Dipteronia sinensis]
MIFPYSEFWVQIHRVPLLCMTKEIGHFLGGMVGVVSEEDVSGECVGEFLSVRVNVDVSKPLRRCLRVDILGDGEETVMVLWYERLLNHCHQCGMLGHSTQECTDAAAEAGSVGVEGLPFGPWLQALAPERGRYRRSGYFSGTARGPAERAPIRSETVKGRALRRSENLVVSDLKHSKHMINEENIYGNTLMVVIKKGIIVGMRALWQQ